MTAAALVTPARRSLIDRLFERLFATPGPRGVAADARRETLSDFRAGLEAMAHSPMAPPITEYAHYIIARQYGGGQG